jgi:hypothetical protein
MFMKFKKGYQFFIVLLWCLASIFPGKIVATSYRVCPDDSSCEIGEFLFDDTYQKITDATCKFTSRNPDGSLYLDEVVMSVDTNDGWYSILVTTTSKPYGLYRSFICCNDNGSDLCLDKSFVIASADVGTSLTEQQVADAVWDEPRAGHNDADSFGENLQTPSTISAADIWNYPTRTLSSFGSLVANIWDYSARTLSSFGSLLASIKEETDPIKSTVDEIKTETTQIQTTTEQIQTTTELVATQTNELVEKVTSEPIVETFIEEGALVPEDLQVKIKQTKDAAKVLLGNTSTLKTQIASLNNNWETTSYQLALNEVTDTSRILGASTQSSQLDSSPVDSSPTDVVGIINWLKQEWESPIINNLATQASSALTNTNSISREIRNYGKTALSKEYLGIATQHLNKLEDLVGLPSDSASQNTLYGYIKDLEETSDQLADYSELLASLLTNWQYFSTQDAQEIIADLRKEILAINRIPDADYVLKLQSRNGHYLENQALALRGIIDSNFYLLAQKPDEAVVHVWLEYGSVIFRSLVTNPSSSTSITAPVKYYLPKELTLENIIKKDDWLTISYDIEKEAYYARGTIDLAPSETKTFSIEVVDVWTISEEEIASIRKQAETLFQPLKNTSYFAQGSTIKVDIEVSLDKIALLQKQAQTPEAKIRSYREAQLELTAADKGLADLKTLVTSAGSAGTLFGFVGGVQALAVWGLVVILVAGFVFLAIYLRMIAGKPRSMKKISLSSQDIHKKSTFGLIKDIISIKMGRKN